MYIDAMDLYLFFLVFDVVIVWCRTDQLLIGVLSSLLLVLLFVRGGGADCIFVFSFTDGRDAAASAL